MDDINVLFNDDIPFEQKALQVFQFQSRHVAVYRQFLAYQKINSGQITVLKDIPFLPVELFKSQKIIADKREAAIVFHSSGTTSQQPSKHFIHDAKHYEQSIFSSFYCFFGSPKTYCILGLLPGYLARKNASLVYMLNYLMKTSGHPLNDFFSKNYQTLANRIEQLEKTKQPTLLFAVTHAISAFAKAYPKPLKYVKIIETGGMKGIGKETTRQALHDKLKTAFRTENIYSEYGMTEMLSQAYCLDGEQFEPSPTMHVMARDVYDPGSWLETGKAGLLCIIDLANVYSCSFLATQDIGTVAPDGRFTILGRADNADIRGCNLMQMDME